MSAGTRRFNYTGRRRIAREHAAIAVRSAADGGAPTFDARLALTGYALPPGALVFVEAYRQSAYQRFYFGTVDALRPAEDRALTEFGAGDGVSFRVKVVEPHADAAPCAAEGVASTGLARILAQADQIRPEYAGRPRSLLPLDPWDSRDEVWRLEIDKNTGPLLKVSKHLAPDGHSLSCSSEFVSLAMPEVLRRVLTEALADGVPDSEEDRGTWPWKWARLACVLVGTDEPPEEIEDDPDRRDEWINEVVTSFCRSHNVAKTFGRWWRQGGEA